MKTVPLLMTAAVSTRGMKGACFQDREREKMYVDALTYYIREVLPRHPGQAIVFAENSGWDLTSIQHQLPPYEAGRIEFVSLDPAEFDISRGKGYNEVLMINEVIKRSRLIENAGAFLKATGRYPIYNIGYFLRQAARQLYERGNDLYCDMKDHHLYDWLRLGWNGHSFECRLFGAKTDWYLANMAPAYRQCNDYDGHLMETVMFGVVKEAMARGDRVVTRFRREPHLGGLEGSEINAFIFSKSQDSLKGKCKRLVGNCIRTFTPWFKF